MSLLNDALKASKKKTPPTPDLKNPALVKGKPGAAWHKKFAWISLVIALSAIAVVVFLRHRHLANHPGKTPTAAPAPAAAVNKAAPQAEKKPAVTPQPAVAKTEPAKPAAPATTSKPAVAPPVTPKEAVKPVVSAPSVATATTKAIPADDVQMLQTKETSFSKSVVPVDAQDALLLEYQQALKAIDAGEIEQAMLLLGKPGLLKATNGDSALTLAKLLLKKRETISAEIVLKHAMERYPAKVPLITKFAEVKFAQKKYKAALTTLSVMSPPLATHPTYYSLMARCYMETDKTEQAVELYEQIVSKFPHQSKWWVGLGLALQANHEGASAVEAYNKALSLGGLSPEVVLFVKDQIRQFS